MSDREILEKYVGLDKSCLSDSEKKQVMDMLFYINRRMHLVLEMKKVFFQIWK